MQVDAEEPTLFHLPPRELPEPLVKRIKHPIWTENKAKLIERYLYYFVLITKHGTYIDGFAGPQEPAKPHMWAARLVLESEPRRLRHFYLFEQDKVKVRKLQELKRSQPQVKPSREIHIYPGDFNSNVAKILTPQRIRSKEAVFCLLDQHTFECWWETVKKLANYKSGSKHKIELFYFLAARWFARAVSGVKDDKIEKWWGRGDWEKMGQQTPLEVQEEICKRLKRELGYRSAKAWPIYDKSGISVMYYMIHATDHPVAPELMSRAYDRAVQPKEPSEQLDLEFAGLMEKSS